MAFTSVLIFSILAAASVLYILNYGWKSEVTHGNLGPFSIGQTKSEVVEKLSHTEHASAIIIDHETILLTALVADIRRDQSGVSWQKAVASDVWKFSPNIGHEFYHLQFSYGILSNIRKYRYFW